MITLLNLILGVFHVGEAIALDVLTVTVLVLIVNVEKLNKAFGDGEQTYVEEAVAYETRSKLSA